MYQIISEAVSVLGIFENYSFTPKKFKWNNRIYPVEKITSIHTVREGNLSKRCYAVVSAGNLYLLEYKPASEAWILDQVWCEG